MTEECEALHATVRRLEDSAREGLWLDRAERLAAVLGVSDDLQKIGIIQCWLKATYDAGASRTMRFL